MPEKTSSPVKKSFSPDWLVRGVLTKIGDIFDNLTGRGWKPSSNLATSELIERLKRLLDAEMREDGKGRFVPHNVKLKMQWDKFSTDGEAGLKKLENELLIAAIDYINDNRYHTYAPFRVEVKQDYFTEGVRLQASFDEFAPEPDQPEAEVNVSLPHIKVGEFVPPPTAEEIKEIEEAAKQFYTVEYTLDGKARSKEIELAPGKRLSVGRTKENALSIDETSISKNHATLMLNREGNLLVSDTGSSNGTFINGERIPYGRALAINEGDKINFGNVEVYVRRAPEAAPFVSQSNMKTDVIDTNSMPDVMYQRKETKPTQPLKDSPHTIEERKNFATSDNRGEIYQTNQTNTDFAEQPASQPSTMYESETENEKT